MMRWSFMTSFSSTADGRKSRALSGRKRERNLVKNSRGTAAVEFGILLPFMVVLLAGVADVGRSIWQHHTLQKGARDAARYLSHLPTPLTAAQRTAAKNLMLRGDFAGTKPLHFGHWSSSVTTNLDSGTGLLTPYDNSAKTFRGPSTINTITVTASVSAPAEEFPLLSLFGQGTVHYSAHYQMRNIGE